MNLFKNKKKKKKLNVFKETNNKIKEARKNIKDKVFKKKSLSINERNKVNQIIINSIIEKLAESDKPVSHDINEYLFYINGLDTNYTKAKKNIKYIDSYFKPRETRLIHNKTLARQLT